MSADIVAALTRISTATITNALLKKGLRNVWLRGARSLHAGQPRVAGRAFTMRFVPQREDISNHQALASPRSTRVAIEDLKAGEIAVVGACGITDAGIFGDILTARLKVRGAAGLVTDGSLRDLAGLRKVDLPVWCAGVAAPASIGQLAFVDWQQPIGCGGVAIFPGDFIVADDDGAVVVPPAYAEEVVESGKDAEAVEDWILERVLEGRKLPGLYPPNEAAMAEYNAEKSKSR